MIYSQAFLLSIILNSLLIESVILRDGTYMPSLGFGTWNIANKDVETALNTAIDSGYRHIDCAMKYNNEIQIGRVLNRTFAKGLLSRSDFWITSKFPSNIERPISVIPMIKASIQALQVRYLDLYLIHWPFVLTSNGVVKKYDRERISQIWKEFEKAVHMGLVKHIGVSNFTPRKLENLMETARLPIEVNQVELHPFLTQMELRAFCDKHHIAITAYSPLGSPGRPKAEIGEEKLIENHDVRNMGIRRGCTIAQVLIQWSLKRGNVVIPKSATPERIKSNFLATNCKLTGSDLAFLDSLNRNSRYLTGSHYLASGQTIADLWDEAAKEEL